MTVETTKERIIEAASKCPQAKQTLKTLFPEVFKDEIDLSNLKFRTGPTGWWNLESNGNWIMCESRLIEKYRSKAVRLNDAKFSWELKTVNGDLLLIPTRK